MSGRVKAVILAAGSGRRIGMPKLRLELEGRSFLAIVAASLAKAGVRDMVAVVRLQDLSWMEAAHRGFHVAVNPHPENGMISSLRCGLQTLGARAALLVVPVDHPFVQSATHAALIQAAKEHPRAVVKPQYRGKCGHPVLIPPSLAASILRGAENGGLDSWIRTSGLENVRVPVADSGIHRNVNLAADLGGRGHRRTREKGNP